MNDEWDVEQAKPDLQSMLPNVYPFRVDPRDAARKAKAIPAKSRRYECPGCGITRWVEPVFSGEEWHYFGQCSHCGASWVNAYRLMIKCEDCGKKNAITSRNPDGKCKCAGETPRPF